MLNETVDSTNVKQNKRILILDNFKNVLHWVHQFKPEAVTYDHLMLPENLRTLHEFSRTISGADFQRASKQRGNSRPVLESGNFYSMNSEKFIRHPPSQERSLQEQDSLFKSAMKEGMNSSKIFNRNYRPGSRESVNEVHKESNRRTVPFPGLLQTRDV